MYQRIVVPVDGSPTSKLGVAEAIKLARLTGAKLKFLHAVDMMSPALSPEISMATSPTVFEMLREGGRGILSAAEKVAKEAGIPCETVLTDTLSGRVCDVVADEAAKWEADLVIIGTHGRRGVGRLLMGSDAEQIARLAPAPVLLVRARTDAAAGGWRPDPVQRAR